MGPSKGGRYSYFLPLTNFFDADYLIVEFCSLAIVTYAVCLVWNTHFVGWLSTVLL